MTLGVRQLAAAFLGASLLAPEASFGQEKAVASYRTPSAQQRIGLSGPPMPLALRDAMLLALENNRDIEIERANLDFSRAGLLRARGAFDPIWSSGPLFRSEKLPVASVLA